MGPTFPFVFVDTSRTFGMQPFGFLVGLGVVLCEHFASERAKKKGYDARLFRSFVFWQMGAGLTFAHVLDAIFYHPDLIARDPLYLFRIWDGLSSFGGFIGALVGGIGWKFLTFATPSHLPKLRAKPLPLLPFLEIGMATFPIAFTFGRIGCSLVHDHPGALVAPGSPFAVAWPVDEHDGIHRLVGPLHVVWGSTTRYDLGLLELLFDVCLVLALVLTWKRRLPLGTYTAVVALTYSPVRFAMDFLRLRDGGEADLRYGALTFAQWVCIAFFLCGCYFAWKVHASKGRWGSAAESEVSGAT